jgi:hypothetical protein
MRKNIKLESLQAELFTDKAKNAIVGGKKWLVGPPGGPILVPTPPPTPTGTTSVDYQGNPNDCDF